LDNKVEGISIAVLKQQLKQFETLHLQDVYLNRKDSRGQDKDWHFVEVIARRIDR